jgi:hypothetical protein
MTSDMKTISTIDLVNASPSHVFCDPKNNLTRDESDLKR